MATLAELARQHPAVIRRAIHENHDGTFTVSLFDAPVRGPVPSGAPKPITVLVDRKLPLRNDKLVYSNRATTSALWPELLEKAWAKQHGGYEAIGHGGNTANVFRAFGFGFAEYKIGQTPPAKLWTAIEAAIAHGDCVVAGTPVAEQVQGLLGGHAYSILSVRVAPDDRRFDPLAQPRWLARGNGSGSRLRMHDFAQGFRTVVIGSPAAGDLNP